MWYYDRRVFHNCIDISVMCLIILNVGYNLGVN